MRVVGAVDVTLAFTEEIEIVWRCWVVPSFAHGALLGTDFLEAAGVTMSFTDKSFSFESHPGQAVPLQFHREGSTDLYLLDDITMEPYEEARTTASLHDPTAPPLWWHTDKTVEVVPAHSVAALHGVVCARGFDTLTKGCCTIQLANPHPQTTVIPAGTHIGSIVEPDVMEMGTIAVLNGDELEDEDYAVYAQAVLSLEVMDADDSQAIPAGREFTTDGLTFQNLNRNDTPEEQRERVSSQCGCWSH